MDRQTAGEVRVPAVTILVVEDEADLASLVEVNLELAGYTVALAADGVEALQALQGELPDAVLLDVMMPRIDGWSVLQEIKEEERTRDLPVVMLTALSEERDLIRGHLEGAVEYVTKPFEMRHLLAVVEQAIAVPTEEELVLRRSRTRKLLQRLAELDSGRPAAQSVRLSALERTPPNESGAIATAGSPIVTDDLRERLTTLTEKQRWLAAALGADWGAREIAEHLDVSRSNVYATRKRVARKLGVDPDAVGAVAGALGIADEAGPPPD
jgi:CheY-like chemotaxis protein